MNFRTIKPCFTIDLVLYFFIINNSIKITLLKSSKYFLKKEGFFLFYCIVFDYFCTLSNNLKTNNIYGGFFLQKRKL